MTDNEIIKANDILDKFDFFNQPAGYEHWMGVPEGIKVKNIKDKENDIKFLKDLFNRLQAEIEQWKVEANRWQNATIIDLKDEEEIKAEARKEFADLVSAEINRALKNNHKVKQERISKLIEKGVAYNDEFCNYCDGKIHALCGIGDFVQSLVKELGVNIDDTIRNS